MGIIELFLSIIIVVLLGAFTVWAIGYFAPSPSTVPAFVPKLIWFIVIVVILFMVVRAFGLAGYDPLVPNLRGPRG